ncbi:MAG: site-2 protease family protein [Acidimicrobiales bacterium]
MRIGLKAVFLGGYVKIPGMTPSEVVSPDFDEARTYRSASHFGRLMTILAGPATNMVCAVGAFTVAAMMGGYSLIDAVGVSFDYIYIVVEGTAQALGTWVTGIGGYLGATVNGTQPPVRFLSPISQAEITSDAVSAGWSQALIWFGILSCAIGGINLLPLPPLDGSHAVMAVTEWVAQITRRDKSIRFDLKRLEPLAYVTLFALAILSVSALVMDIRSSAPVVIGPPCPRAR